MSRPFRRPSPSRLFVPSPDHINPELELSLTLSEVWEEMEQAEAQTTVEEFARLKRAKEEELV